MKTPLWMLVGWIALGQAGVADPEARRVAAGPYWPDLEAPRLVTPQWVGADGVDAVVVLSIDDMRDTGAYESFLRPILDRLKRIDGRAPVSISTLGVDPENPQLQEFLREGVSIESHTMDHPCPLLAGGDFGKARTTVMMNVDLLSTIPNTSPVAFRMPCCDSMNAVSPRFFSEILHRRTPAGNILQADSSVFNLFTPDDPDLPRELIAPDGEEGGRFEKYVPRSRGFVNLIENYPYPYAITDRGFCDRSWQIPGTVPSDWEAHHLHGSKNPETIEDLKAAIDCTVLKQGIFTLVFHPHGWIENTQVVELIDHAVAKHGNKVLFLNLREVVERLNANVLGGRALQREDQQQRIRDVDGDGYMDVVLQTEGKVRLWKPEQKRWMEESRTVELPQRDWFASGSLRVDLDGDGDLDEVHSDAHRFGVRLLEKGEWKSVYTAERGERPAGQEIPMIVRADGSLNGAWVKDGWLYVQNEDTGGNPGQVERRRLEDVAKPLPSVDALPDIKPRSPEEALQSMRTRPELRVELVASEPLVMDPVDVAWDADGTLWVVEMADYPNGMDGKGAPGGRVRRLEDLDGDGRYDEAILFAEGLNFPTGVLPWNGGVLVTAAPEVLWLRDRDGDGKADERQVLYDGFRTGNPQHRVNGLRWGLDNWIHIANGDSDGLVRSAKTGKTVDIRGRDLRIRPAEGLLDAQSGETQFGRCRDDWGNWFGNNNSNALWHYTLADHYLRRNPYVGVAEVRQMVPEERGRLQLYPASTTVERFNDFDTADRITSACGTGLYRDQWLGEEFYGNAFVCEPVHNLVTRQVLSRRGLSFTSRRAIGEEEREFLSSTDNWFRPVTVRTGPDGALYVVDMYRHVIEHPEWIPSSWQERLDLRAGDTMGRIYRIVRDGGSPRTVPPLDGMTGAELVRELLSPNGPRRDLAHMELVRRKEEGLAELIRGAMPTGHPAARVQMLAVLDGLGRLGVEDVLTGLRDESPEVRRMAVRLAERVGSTDDLMERLGELLQDGDERVRHQVHLSLGAIENPRADHLVVEALSRIGSEEHDAAIMRAGLLSSVTPEVAAKAILELSIDELGGLVDQLIATARAGGDGKELLGVAERLVLGADRGEDLSMVRLGTAAALAEGAAGEVRAVLTRLSPRAETIALQTGSPVELRVAAIEFLEAVGSRVDVFTKVILAPVAAPEVTAAAARGFAANATREEGVRLLAQWERFPPTVRRQVVESFLGRVALSVALVEQARAEAAVRRGLSQSDLARMRESGLAPVRQAAEEFARGTSSPTLASQMAKFEGLAEMEGDTGRGRDLFVANCTTCHRVEGVGLEVGPDLAALTNRSVEALLAAIVDPNAAVEDKYLGYILATTGDETLLGCIEAETSTSVLLKTPTGEARTVLRQDLASLRSSGRSLMPEGYGASFSAQQMADLVAYLQGVRPPPKSFGGNAPGVIGSEEDGSFILPASKAFVYGPRLAFGQQFNVLEYWESEHDYAVWAIDCKQAGTYAVALEIGCETRVENRFQVLVGEQRLAGVVPQTKTWIDFQRHACGKVELQPGRHELVVRSDGPVESFLMDLRTVHLTPVR